MTKRQLVINVAEQLGITQNEVSDVVQTTLETITEALAAGDRLEIRNFGVFEVKVRDARLGRNPRTGESVPIAEKRIPIFKPGKALKEWVEQADPTGKAPSTADPSPDDAPENTLSRAGEPF
ncbi:MAG: integration host factor subunit beta [Candidatus Hydrogenedentes bacterium]|nr:integration host factor subunit beta [Candidatus Hydrogenedentota bacterium]